MSPLIRKVDAVTVPVPDLGDGLRFYRPHDPAALRARLVGHLDGRGSDLVLVDLSKGRYTTDEAGQVTGVTRDR